MRGFQRRGENAGRWGHDGWGGGEQNPQRNGLSGPEEMQLARKHFGISITQNSYGLQLSRSCAFIKQIGYLWSDRALDLLSNWYPTLTHIFAAGNDQAGCIAETYSIWGAPGYGTTTQRSKNTVVVGAVTDGGKMASFSSWGPTDDGRLSPTVCAKGVDVWSTKPGNEYQSLEGTSMACPTVSGHASLLQERYAQLFAGRLYAQRPTVGTPGQYGYRCWAARPRFPVRLRHHERGEGDTRAGAGLL